MSKIVYTSSSQVSPGMLLLPHRAVADILKHFELIRAYTRREFYATYRETILGWAWSIFTPLIMLALFTFVFGYIFHGRFNQSDASESPAQFALALFIGMSLFNCVGQTLNSAPNLILANSAYVKTLSFPLEIISISAVSNIAINLGIGLAMCFIGFIAMHGFIHLSAIALIPYVLCVLLMSVGISWFMSALGVFVRDIAPLTGPLTMVLMFVSGVFFPLSSVPGKAAWLFKLNPIARIIDGARASFLYGIWPNPLILALLLTISMTMAMVGYWFFMKSKQAFADVV
jgi:lipopolysaccharide transport system permease protein